jgi:RNA polymerase sigma factor for flagellar operon FliA
VALYYYGEATMKQIGAEIGVNESRVSQLHARAIQRLKKALGADCASLDAAEALRPAILAFQQTMRRMRMAKAADQRGVVLPYKAPVKSVAPARRRAVEPRLAAAR